MALRGERFHVDLDMSDDEDEQQQQQQQQQQPANAANVEPSFVKDILERPVLLSSASTPHPPTAPTPRTSSNAGFPAHKKRTGAATSRFKQARETARDAAAVERDPLERQQREIDQENRDRLARMTPEAIAQEQKELLQALSPSLVSRLIKRSAADNTKHQQPQPQQDSLESPPQQAQSIRVPSQVMPTHAATLIAQASTTEPKAGLTAANAKSRKTVTFGDAAAADIKPAEQTGHAETRDAFIPAAVPAALKDVHFPRPPQPPELDPSAPGFLQDLHDKYYPDLPADPSKLAWMSDPTADEDDDNDDDNAHGYSPFADASIPFASLRFSFTGELLSPAAAREIPVTEGLHHHGAAPSSAGYTVPELAHLARSSVPAQRCIAYKSLGRILYRLGTAGYGPRDSPMYHGLWACLDAGRVLDTLQQEANKDRGHMSARAYATEALWLWRKSLDQTVPSNTTTAAATPATAPATAPATSEQAQT